MRMKLIQRVLKRLNDSSEQIEACALISSDGLIINSALPKHIDDAHIGAKSAALLAISERACCELKRGNIEQFVIQCEGGFLMGQYVGDEALLTVLVSSDGNLGRLFISVRDITHALNILLKEVYDDYK